MQKDLNEKRHKVEMISLVSTSKFLFFSNKSSFWSTSRRRVRCNSKKLKKHITRANSLEI